MLGKTEKVQDFKSDIIKTTINKLIYCRFYYLGHIKKRVLLSHNLMNYQKINIYLIIAKSNDWQCAYPFCSISVFINSEKKEISFSGVFV